MEFSEWIKEHRWEERYQKLKAKKNQVWDKNYKRVEQNLLDETEKLIH